MKTTLSVTVDKSHIITIGEKLYTESIELIRELVNNAYDADAATQPAESVIYGCAFVCATQRDPATCMSRCLADNYANGFSGCMNGYPVYYAYTMYSTNDDLRALTIEGKYLQDNDHAQGIYNNLHKTISIRLGDMSCVAASTNPLSFPRLYYRLMTHDNNGNWISSAIRGEQWMIIESPQPAGGGCTIGHSSGNESITEWIILYLIACGFIIGVRYAKR